MTDMIHWHEGLFLQQHHLQMMQHGAFDETTRTRAMAMAYPYGLVDARLSPDALENMTVRFDRLKVVMPSGLQVDIQRNARLEPRDIKDIFSASASSFVVRLGVPRWESDRANTVPPTGADAVTGKRLFQVEEIERTDENTGDQPQPIMVRKINARLLLEDDDDTGMETLPLLRIAHAAGDDVGLPHEDPEFIPPSLFLTGSVALRDALRDLSSQVEASRSELVNQITRGGFNIEAIRGVQFEQMLRLKTLNRYAGRLRTLIELPNMPPLNMYFELRDLLSELAALQPGRDPFESPQYDHDNPAVAFYSLHEKIRALLRGAVTDTWMQVKFAPTDDVLIARLNDEHLSLPNQYFLGVRTREDPKALAQLVEDPDRFKMMCGSLVQKTVFGVKLQEERHPPLELPSETGLHYFTLLRNESKRMWDRVKEEKVLAVRFPGMEASDYQMTLYMTTPAGGSTG